MAELVGRRLGVKRQEVLPRGAESGDGCDAADSLMRAMPVVVVCPVVEGGGALGRALVGEAIGPLSEG